MTLQEKNPCGELACLHSRSFNNRKYLAHHKLKKEKSNNKDQLAPFIRPEWDNIPLLKLQQMVLLLPRCFQTAVKRSSQFALSFNMWYVLYDLLGIKYGFMRFANHCILFLFIFYTASKLFWNCVCTTYIKLKQNIFGYVSSTLFNLCHQELRQFLKKKGVQPNKKQDVPIKMLD